MEHPLILEFLHDLKLVLENEYVGLKVNGTGLGGTEVFHTSVTGMKEISEKMQELVERRDQQRTELESLLFWRNVLMVFMGKKYAIQYVSFAVDE